MFVANLGSIGVVHLPPLFEYGTCHIFLAVERAKDHVEIRDGVAVAVRGSTRYTYDERADDGINCRHGFTAMTRAREPRKWLGCLADDGSDTGPGLEDWRATTASTRAASRAVVVADEPRILGTSAHGLLVVHKPAGMRVHPANDDGVPDLLTWLRTQGSIPPDTAPVQRLDQGTSGLLLCGATSNHRAMASAWLTEVSSKRPT